MTHTPPYLIEGARLRRGSVVELDDATARRLIDRRWATPVFETADNPPPPPAEYVARGVAKPPPGSLARPPGRHRWED